MRIASTFLKEHGKDITFYLICSLVLGVFGFFFHDLLLFLEKNDTEMTVFPLGTFFVYMWMVIQVSLIVFRQSLNNFNLSMSMGSTRKRFFLNHAAKYSIYMIISNVMAFGVFKLEMWKFERFYYPRYALELDMTGVFKPSIILAMMVGGVALSLLFISFSLKFGNKAFFVGWFLYIFCFVFLPRILHKINLSDLINLDSLDTFTNVIFVMVVILSAMAIAVSRAIVMKQAVKM